MSLTVGVVMDPIDTIKPWKDTTLAMLLEVQRRGWSVRYMEPGDLYLRDGEAMARWQGLTVRDDHRDWFDLTPGGEAALRDNDVILMRKDPPFNMEYIYTTYILQRAEAAGTLVVNRPGALRDVSEKMYTAWFPECCPPTLITRDLGRLRGFLAEHEDIVAKPLDGMGGESVFRLRGKDPNASVVFETLTARGTRFAMAQRYIPAITEGDKRILLIDGEPVPYGLARIPAAGELRGNLAAGARGEGRGLTDRERWICEVVGPVAKDRGLMFVGLDVIGEYLTEINVTSPTCVRELDAWYDINISAQLMDVIQHRVTES